MGKTVEKDLKAKSMQKTNIQHLITLILCLILMGIFGQNVIRAEIDVGFGDGSDSDLTATNEVTVDDVRTAVTGSNAAGENTIEISDASEFSVGDEVLIISMQDPDTDLELNVAGQYETKRITVIAGNILTLDSTLTYTYDAGNFVTLTNLNHIFPATTRTTDFLSKADRDISSTLPLVNPSLSQVRFGTMPVPRPSPKTGRDGERPLRHIPILDVRIYSGIRGLLSSQENYP